MNADETPLVPLQYPLTWAFLAIVLVGLVITFYLFVFFMTRRKKAREEVFVLPDSGLSYDRLAYIKNKYVEEAVQVGVDYDAGQLTTRKAFQTLSVLLRNFSHEYSRTGAYAMTLTDLKNNQVDISLQQKVQNLYPFALKRAEKEGNVKLAVADAIEVITKWR